MRVHRKRFIIDGIGLDAVWLYYKIVGAIFYLSEFNGRNFVGFRWILMILVFCWLPMMRQKRSSWHGLIVRGVWWVRFHRHWQEDRYLPPLNCWPNRRFNSSRFDSMLVGINHIVFLNNHAVNYNLINFHAKWMVWCNRRRCNRQWPNAYEFDIWCDLMRCNAISFWHHSSITRPARYTIDIYGNNFQHLRLRKAVIIIFSFKCSLISFYTFMT